MSNINLDFLQVLGALFYSFATVIMTRYLSDLYISVMLSIPAILALLGTLVFLKWLGDFEERHVLFIISSWPSFYEWYI